jgi:hypothetical protein
MFAYKAPSKKVLELNGEIAFIKPCFAGADLTATRPVLSFLLRTKLNEADQFFQKPKCF